MPHTKDSNPLSKHRHRLPSAVILSAAILLGATTVDAELNERDGFFHWMLPAEEMQTPAPSPAEPVARAEGQSARISEHEQIAWDFLAQQDSGINDPRTELRLARHNLDAAGNHHFRFFHVVDGIHLGDTEILVHVSPAGTVFAYNGFAEPSMADFRTRAHAHREGQGLRLSPPDLLEIIKEDSQSDSAQITELQARVDDQYETIYWLARTNISSMPPTTIYHIADANGEILDKQVEFRSFLPLNRE